MAAQNSTLFVNPLTGLEGSDWYFEYIEIHDLRLCDESVLEDAYREAPTSEAKAYIFAIHQFRSVLCSVSGRPMRMNELFGEPPSLRSEGPFVCTKAEDGVWMIKQVAEKVGGVFGTWKACGSWQHCVLDVSGVKIQIGVSTQGIIHLDGNPFSPLGRATNVTEVAVEASLKALLLTSKLISEVGAAAHP